jgi:16S rRNA processing protein RimM
MVVQALSQVLEGVEAGTQLFLGPGRIPATVAALSPHKKRFLLTLENVEDRDHAEELRGMELQLPMEAAEPLPEGIYYYWQLLGIQVFTDAGEHLGELVEILETGANDVYVVQDAHGEQILLPAIDSVIQEIDLDSGRMQVHLLPGLRP